MEELLGEKMMSHYRKYWVNFIYDFILGPKSREEGVEYKLTPKQERYIRDVQINKRTMIFMNPGEGKTAVSALLALTYTMLYPYSKVVLSQHSIDNILWPELQKWVRNSFIERFISCEHDYIKHNIDPNSEWRIYKRAKQDCMSCCGIHAEDLLVIVDDAMFAPDECLDGYNGSITGENNKMVITNRLWTF